MRQPPEIFYGVKRDEVELRKVISGPFTRVTLERYFGIHVDGNMLWSMADRGLIKILRDVPPQAVPVKRKEDPKALFAAISSYSREKCLWYEVIEERREEVIEELQALDAASRLG
jgi:hypothetical protein